MKKLALPLLMSVGLLQGCIDSSSDSDSTLSLGITDAPVSDASSVVVQFSGLELHSGGDSINIDFDTPKSIDLLDFQGSASSPLLENETLPAGNYQWIRLKVDTDSNMDTYIQTSEGTFELAIPSGAESGLKLVQGFTLPANGSADFTIDFDVRKSIVLSGTSDYKLRPALRLVDNVEVGHISGTVDSASLVECAAPSVYAYEGSGVTPVEEGDANTAVVASSLVDDAGEYEIGFLVAGDYTVAFTCDEDTAEAGDTVNFSGAQDVTVTANSTETANF